MAEDQSQATIQRIWGRVMPGPVRDRLLLTLTVIFAAIGFAGSVVTIAGAVGWPKVWAIARISGLVFAVTLSLLLHVLTVRALMKEVHRADREAADRTAVQRAGTQLLALVQYLIAVQRGDPNQILEASENLKAIADQLDIDLSTPPAVPRSPTPTG